MTMSALDRAGLAALIERRSPFCSATAEIAKAMRAGDAQRVAAVAASAGRLPMHTAAGVDTFLSESGYAAPTQAGAPSYTPTASDETKANFLRSIGMNPDRKITAAERSRLIR